MNGPVLIVGWDGACWSALEPWIEDGRLPTLARLRREGAWGGLRSTAPPVTPAAWTAMATGLGPGRTGVLGFRHLDLRRPSGYCATSASSADLQGRTLFEHALGHREGVALAGWPMTWPPFPLPGGVLLSGWPRPRERRPPVWPQTEGRRVGAWGDGAPPQSRGLPSIAEEIARASWFDRRHAEIAGRWIRRRRDGIVAVVFSGYDHLAHRLWGDDRLAQHAQRIDRHLAGLLEAAGPGTRLMLVSDHGFGAAPRQEVHLDRWLEREGWSTRLGGVSTAGGLAGKLRSAVPARAWRAVRDRLPGELRRAAYERARGLPGLDLAACRAVRVPLHEGWDGLHLLVRGRTEGGVLAPEAAGEALDRLERTLAAARLPSGRRVVAGLERTPTAGELAHRVPDLVVDFGDDARGGAGVGEGPLEELVEDEEIRRFPGAHRREGLVLLHGPGRTGEPPRAPNVVDVVATALAWRGVPLPDDLDARVWQEAIAAPARYESARPSAPSAPPPRRDIDAGELERLGYLRGHRG